MRRRKLLRYTRNLNGMILHSLPQHVFLLYLCDNEVLFILPDVFCRELFTTVIDMLATLIHSTLVSDSQSEKEENRKHYQNLMKKLKKVSIFLSYCMYCETRGRCGSHKR